MLEQSLSDRLRAVREAQEAREAPKPSSAEPERAPERPLEPEPPFEPEPALEAGPAREPLASRPAARMLLGELLVERGLLSKGDLMIALGQQRQDGRPLGQILLEMGAVTQGELARTLTEQHGFDFNASLRRRLAAVDEPEPREPSAAEPPLEPARYVVRETDDAEPLHVADSFLDAADAAFELIEERDPDRLEIVRTGAQAEQLWSYCRDEAGSAPPAA